MRRSGRAVSKERTRVAREISQIRKMYRLNPIRDLRPVCPNCHTIIHLRAPAYKVKEVKSFLRKERQAHAAH
ncbi:MAG: hypothetical protein AB1714_11820 [Acidobacteriota bacterium]